MKRINAGHADRLNTLMASPNVNSKKGGVLRWNEWTGVKKVQKKDWTHFSLLPPLFLWCLIFLWRLRSFSLRKERHHWRLRNQSQSSVGERTCLNKDKPVGFHPAAVPVVQLPEWPRWFGSLWKCSASYTASDWPVYRHSQMCLSVSEVFVIVFMIYGQKLKRFYLGFLGEKNEKLLILFNVENEVRDGFGLTKNFSLKSNQMYKTFK